MIPVSIELDRVRHIRYPWRAVVDVETAAKKGLPQIMLTPGVTSLTYLLWAGLMTEDPGLTFDTTGDLIQAYIDKGGKMDDLETAIIKGLKSGGWVQDSPNPPGG